MEDVSLGDVLAELARRRDDLTESGQSPSLRTSSLTHIAWVPKKWVSIAHETLAGLSERHPARGILLVPNPDAETDQLDAEVEVLCFQNAAHKRDVCSEVVTLFLNGSRADAPGSVVTPLLISDLPVFLRWRGEVPFSDQPLEQLIDLADRLIVDSDEWRDAAASFGSLAPLCERIAVSDVAWSRTDPWREAIAALWPSVSTASRLRVVGPTAQALLLARWLGERLGRNIELDHEVADRISAVVLDGRTIEARGREYRSQSELLSEHLDEFGRDPIYEEAIWSFSPARI